MADFLDKQVFMSMLHFEEILLGGQVSRETIQELIALYAQCVEFYDSIHDPIQFYFLEKMQILLARESTLKEIGIFKQHKGNQRTAKMHHNRKKSHGVVQHKKEDISDVLEKIGNQNDKFTTPKGQFQGREYECQGFDEKELAQESKKTKINTSQEPSSNNDGFASEESEDEAKEEPYEDKFKGLSMTEMRLRYKQTPKHAKYSISKKRLERSKRVGMYFQLQNEQATTLDAGELFQQHINVSAAQVDTVKQNLNLQLEDFHKRLQKRKTIKEGQGMTPRPQLLGVEQNLDNQESLFSLSQNEKQEEIV